MSLAHDVARCPGQFDHVPFGKALHTACIDCQRRTCRDMGPRTPWSQGEVVDGVCVSKIKEES